MIYYLNITQAIWRHSRTLKGPFTGWNICFLFTNGRLWTLNLRFIFPARLWFCFFLFYFLCNHIVLKANSDTFNLPEYLLICLTYINLHHSDLCSTLALEVIPWLYSEYVTWLGWLYLLDIIPPKSWTLDMFQFQYYESCLSALLLERRDEIPWLSPVLSNSWFWLDPAQIEKSFSGLLLLLIPTER